MLVIRDTSVISNLALIGRLEILERLHDSVIIPEAVCRELGALSNLAAVALIENGFQAGWLSQVVPTDEELDFAATLELDAGEAEAIAIAFKRKADVLCIDEAEGRAVAMELNLPVKGLLRLLLDAKSSGHIESITSCLEDLRLKARFFMTNDLVNRVLALAGE